MMEWVELSKEMKVFNVKKRLGEKTKQLVKHKKNQKNKRNKLKWTLLLIKSNKFLMINKLQSRNVTHEGTRTCPYGTIIYQNFVWLLVLCFIMTQWTQYWIWKKKISSNCFILLPTDVSWNSFYLVHAGQLHWHVFWGNGAGHQP